MTLQANILPLAYRRRCRQIRRFRWWLGSVAVVGVGQLMLATVLGYMAQETRDARAQMAGLRERQQSQSKELAFLTMEENQLTRKLQLSEDLRRKHRWSELLALLAKQLPETVVLTEMETIPPRGDPPGAGADNAKRNADGTPAAAPLPHRAVKGLIMAGVAVDHESIAAFLRTMNASSRFDQCQLQSTKRQQFKEGEGIAFQIQIGW